MTLVVANLGAGTASAGGTEAACRKARELGADWVELNVRRTADGMAAVYHDAHLPDGRRIAMLRNGGLPSEVVGLAEALEACEGMGVSVQIKNLPDDPDYDQDNLAALAVAGLVGAYLSRERSMVSSFNVDDLAAIKSVDPSITLALVCGVVDPISTLARASAHETPTLHVYEAMCTPAFARQAHRAGLDVFAWGVDEAVRMADLVEMGVDGIVTDRPDIARAVVDGS